MAINMETALLMMKQRKDMLPGISQRDDYMQNRLQAVVEELEAKGIHLVDNTADLMLVVDIAVWQYNNRDQAGTMPEWLRLARRERWLNDRRINEEHSAEVNADDS